MATKPKAYKSNSKKPYAKKESGAISLEDLNTWYDYSYEINRRKNWNYFVIDQFLKGNHNIRGNPEDNTIIIGKKTDNINYPINKVYSTHRAIRAFVTRHKPTFTVETEESTPEAKDYARRANKILARDNNLNNGRRLNKEWVYYGTKYGVGWRQIGYDPQKKVSQRWTIDPFDLLVGSATGEAEDAPYLIKTLVRTVGYWRNKFPKANVIPDNEVAADEYKKLIYEIDNQGASTAKNRLEEQTAIGYECWYRVFTPNKNGGLINKCLHTRTEILDVQETPYTEYPFIPYEAEVLPNEISRDGSLKHVISPQRMLNLLNTQMLEFNHLSNRGRYQMEKNSGFRVVMSKEGQIIFHNPGKRIEVLPPPTISDNLKWQIGYADGAIEDIGGQHDASQGVRPSGITAGKAIEALQMGDSNNISDLRDNFEDALSLEASWILKMYSLFEDEGFVITDETKDKTDKFGVVGEEAIKRSGKPNMDKYYIEDNGTYCDVCTITADNKVKVSVVSQLGETREARMDLLFKLREAGIPLKVILDHIEFPNTGDIMERIAEEALADAAIQGIQQQPQDPNQMAALEQLNGELGGLANG